MWGTTQLKKKDHPMMSSAEWKAWKDQAGVGGKYFYENKDDINKAMAERPGGFMVQHDHPGLDSIEDKADVYNVPGKATVDWRFVKPKPVPTS